MKPNAFLINTARGPIVNHKDLYEALTNNIIAGAGLDAFDPEPATPETSPLLKLNNVIVTCHRAGDSITSNKNVAKLAVEQVFRVARGEWPLNILNPEVKEKYTRKWPKIVL
jgi:phosphoglycerate dehydrogenase-like enzyme